MKTKYKLLILLLSLSIFFCGCGGGGDGEPVTPTTTATITGFVSGTMVVAIDQNDIIVDSDDTTGKIPDPITGYYSFSLTCPVGGEYRFFFIENEGTTDERIVPLYDTSGTTNVFYINVEDTIDLEYVDCSGSKAVSTNDPLNIEGVTSRGEETYMRFTPDMLNNKVFYISNQYGEYFLEFDSSGSFSQPSDDSGGAYIQGGTWSIDANGKAIAVYSDNTIATLSLIFESATYMYGEMEFDSSKQSTRTEKVLSLDPEIIPGTYFDTLTSSTYTFLAGGTGEVSDAGTSISFTWSVNNEGIMTINWSGVDIVHTYYLLATSDPPDILKIAGTVFETGKFVGIANHTLIPKTGHNLSGTVTTAGGQGLNGVTIKLSGDDSQTTFTDSNGHYEFFNLPDGSYVITPAMEGYKCTPSSLSVNIAGADVGNQDFTASGIYMVSGHITRSGSGLSGVNVTLSGTISRTTPTDSTGYFEFIELTKGSYTIIPSMESYAFTPASKAVTITNANVTGVDFSASGIYSISGTITYNGKGLGGVTVTLSGDAVETGSTDSNGNYTFTELPEGVFTVTPSKPSYSFSPPNIIVAISGNNATGQDFTTQGVYSISGYITFNGSGLNDVTVDLGGSKLHSVTTGVDGYFAFINLPNGSYTVTPSKDGFAFSPPNAAVTIADDNITDQNFSAGGIYSISGYVTFDGSPLTGITLNLSGALVDEALTNDDGFYEFPNVPDGSYYVTPNNPSYIFSPSSTGVTISGSDVINQNFNATTKVSKIWIQSPIYDERFVTNEEVKLMASVTSDVPVDGSQLTWSSNVDGKLGSGLEIDISGLSLGNHIISVSGYGQNEYTPIRVFNDLWELYQSPPSEGEINRILGDFTINWVDGSGVDEKWEPYDNFDFDQSSTDPSKVVAIAKLDILRHQRFSEPLPITDGKTIYDHLRTFVNTINLRLACGTGYGGGGRITLFRSFNSWHALYGWLDDPDKCKTPSTDPKFVDYLGISLVVHECRHSEPDDPRHMTCDGIIGKDPYFEEGSGKAWSALYEMWIYKYSLYDPSPIREHARDSSTMHLKRSFCTTPIHSDPNVQAIIDELLQE